MPCRLGMLNCWTCSRLLRAELHSLRRRAAIKADASSLDRPTIETHRNCARCLCELGRIINRGAPCRSCRLRVCKACREFTNRTTDWVCLVCHKQMWVSNYQSVASICCISVPTCSEYNMKAFLSQSVHVNFSSLFQSVLFACSHHSSICICM